MRDFGLGLTLTGVVTVVAWLIWGAGVLVAAVVFGLVATLIHTLAVALLRSSLEGPLKRLLKRWAMGMGLRLMGVALFGVAVYLREDLFPAVPTAVAFLGVLLPLMLSEMKAIYDTGTRRGGSGTG